MPGRCLCGSTKVVEPCLPEKVWKVGGRYKANRAGVSLWSSSALKGSKVGELAEQDVVLLLNLVEQPKGPPLGLVLPPGGQVPGWIALEGGPAKSWPLARSSLEGSWEMKARYLVKNPATVREGPAITSAEVVELEPGDEVLVLELGHNPPDGDNDGKVRLRALVSTASGAIGWMSPETSSGDHLLEPVNLLSNKVLDLHRESLTSKGTGGPRRSCQQGLDLPWEVGAQYRVLEQLVLRQGAELTSKTLGKVSAGAIVLISDVQKSECDQLRECPCAFVTVADGPEKGQKGQKGWVRCVATDGRDLIDTRDQLEYEKVLHRLRTSVVIPEGAPAATSAAQMQAQMVAVQRASFSNKNEQEQPPRVDEASDENSSAVQGSKEKSAGSEIGDEVGADSPLPERTEQVAQVPEARDNEQESYQKLVDKLDCFQEVGGKDDRLITDTSIVEDKGYLCNCNCGASRAPATFVRSR